MVEALKRLDKKFLVIAGCLIVIPLLLIVFLAVVQGCSNSKMSYENYEKRMIKSAEKYVKAKKKTPTLEGESFTVSLKELIDDGYIKSTEKLLDDDSCSGSVTVRRNGASITGWPAGCWRGKPRPMPRC